MSFLDWIVFIGMIVALFITIVMIAKSAADTITTDELIEEFEEEDDESI